MTNFLLRVCPIPTPTAFRMLWVFFVRYAAFFVLVSQNHLTALSLLSSARPRFDRLPQEIVHNLCNLSKAVFPISFAVLHKKTSSFLSWPQSAQKRSCKFVDRNAAKRVNKRNETIYNTKAEVLCGKSCADPPYPVWVPALYHRHIEGYGFHISQERSLSL